MLHPLRTRAGQHIALYHRIICLNGRQKHLHTDLARSIRVQSIVVQPLITASKKSNSTEDHNDKLLSNHALNVKLLLLHNLCTASFPGPI